MTPFRVGLLVALLGGAASAKEHKERKENKEAKESPETLKARELFRSGSSHFELREYEAALGDFKEAYRVREDPVFLFNIVQCHRFLGNHEEAVVFYKNYLRNMPTAPNRVEVEARIHGEELAAAEAKRKAEESAVGERRRREMELQAQLARKPPPAPWYKDTVGWILAGGGVALLGGGLGLLGYGATMFIPPMNPGRQIASDQQTAYVAAGSVIGGVGLAALVIGVVKLAIFDKPEKPAVTLSPLAGGGMLTVEGRF